MPGGGRGEVCLSGGVRCLVGVWWCSSRAGGGGGNGRGAGVPAGCWRPVGRAGCEKLVGISLPHPAAEVAMIGSGGSRRAPWPGGPGPWSGLDLVAAPLRGRGTEVGILGEVLDRVAGGRPAVVLIEGEAGIGKTRLLDTALEDARARGMQVARGRAEELELHRPFGLVAAAFGAVRSSADPRRAAIADLLSGHAGDRGPVTVTSDPGLRF